MPVMPAFYFKPKSIDEIVTQYVCRVLAHAGLSQEKMYRWTGSASGKKAGA
jgi:4-hydroxy-3-polyprenylbenzoate decarboxylase